MDRWGQVKSKKASSGEQWQAGFGSPAALWDAAVGFGQTEREADATSRNEPKHSKSRPEAFNL